MLKVKIRRNKRKQMDQMEIKWSISVSLLASNFTLEFNMKTILLNQVVDKFMEIKLLKNKLKEPKKHNNFINHLIMLFKKKYDLYICLFNKIIY
jgi:hypothetical protein